MAVKELPLPFFCQLPVNPHQFIVAVRLRLPVVPARKAAYNEHTGQLPPEWGAPGAFGVLATLWLSNNSLTGERAAVLPWAQQIKEGSLARCG